MTNWIKFHALSLADKQLNPNIRQTREQLTERLVAMFANEKRYTRQMVVDEIDRLFNTGQLALDNDFVTLGMPLFEEQKPVSMKASLAAQAVIDNLKDRRGVGDELEACSDDVLLEIINTLAAIIDKEMT